MSEYRHKGLRLGRLEVLFWRDTGKPLFRVYAHRFPRLSDSKRALGYCRTYDWIFKVMSYWTLWIALKAKTHDP